MSDYLKAAWETAKFTAAVVGVLVAIGLVGALIVVGAGYVFYLIGGDMLLNIITVILWIVGLTWLFVLPVIDLYKSNLRKIRKRKSEDAQVSIN